MSEFSNATHYITSPGYPTGYAENLKCNWVFTSPPGTHLGIRFLSMDLEETDKCAADHVDIYSGFAQTNPIPPSAKQLGRFCLTNESSAHVETSNVMTVKFETDVYVNKTGFKAIVFSGAKS